MIRTKAQICIRPGLGHKLTLLGYANHSKSTSWATLHVTSYTTVTYYHRWVIDTQETTMLNIRNVIDTSAKH